MTEQQATSRALDHEPEPGATRSSGAVRDGVWCDEHQRWRDRCPRLPAHAEPYHDQPVSTPGGTEPSGAVCDCFPHGPDEPCTCDGCSGCSGHVLGCTCDIAWDCEHKEVPS